MKQKTLNKEIENRISKVFCLHENLDSFKIKMHKLYGFQPFEINIFSTNSGLI